MIKWAFELEENILLFLQQYVRDDFLTPIMVGITTLGNAGFVWIVLAAVLLLTKKYRKTGRICLEAIVLSFLINNVVLKHLIARSRPFDVIAQLTPLIPRPTDFSFPSGHTACSFAAGFLLFRKLPKRYGIPVLLLSTLIGFSRLYVGVHYPSDVIFGAVFGIAISYLAELMDAGIERLYHFRKENKTRLEKKA